MLYRFQKFKQFKCISGYVCYNAVVFHDIVHTGLTGWIARHILPRTELKGEQWQIIVYLLSSTCYLIKTIFVKDFSLFSVVKHYPKRKR